MPKDGENSPSPTNSSARARSFGWANRLRGRKAITDIVRRGQRSREQIVALNYAQAEPRSVGSFGRSARFAISVSRHYGKAVARNRMKRVIREFLRQNKPLWPANRWILIKVLDPAYGGADVGARQNEAAVIEELKHLLGHIKARE